MRRSAAAWPSISTASDVDRYPPISGPARSYLIPFLIVLAVVAMLLLGYGWYLSGLEEGCRQKCLTAGSKGYKYAEGTGSGKRFRPGTCSCQ
jgi:hypothetical protein